MTTQRKAHGFTFVDLVLVLIITGALVGLLLPALASSSAVAKANTCQDRMRQIGLALRNFELGNREFPPASFNPSLVAFHPADCRPADASGGKSTTGYSWVVRILPQLGENNLFNNIAEKSQRFAIKKGPFDPTVVTKDEASLHVAAISLQELICPEWAGNKYTRDRTTIDVGRTANADEPANQGAPEYATIDAAVPGIGVASFKGRIGPTSYKPMVGTHVVVGMPAENGGMVLTGTNGLTMGDFPDGTSKTILICESKECGYASWYDGTLNWLVGNDTNKPAPSADDKPPWINAALALNKGFDPKAADSLPYLKKANSANRPKNDVWWGPSSDHANGIVYHVFVDDHVLGITDACDAATYLALITRDGGEPIDVMKIK
jgi:type II secretory pathway pseudopilin PulG